MSAEQVPATKRQRTGAASASPSWAPKSQPQRAQGAAGAAAGADPCVGANVQLAERLRQTPDPLSAEQIQEIECTALAALGRLDPLLRHIVAVKLVRNERRNFVNIRIHKGTSSTANFTLNGRHESRNHSKCTCFV